MWDENRKQNYELVLELDLDTDKYEMTGSYRDNGKESVLEYLFQVVKNDAYSHMLEEYGTCFVYEEFRSVLMDTLCLENLRKLYYIRNNSTVIEYKISDTDSEIHWVKCTVYFREMYGMRKAVIGFCETTKEHQSEMDPLTGYRNFTTYKNEVKELLENRGKTKYSIWYCNLRNFRMLNEVYGYKTGNQLLSFWAKLEADEEAAGESFAHISSDHFTSFRKYKTREELEQRFLRVSEGLKGFPGFQNKEYTPEVVSGVYCIEKDEDIKTLEEMLDCACVAQKSIMGLPGSNVAFYTEEMYKRFLYENELESEMEEALLLGEFQSYFQPIVNINKNFKVMGIEALVRWKRKNGTVLMPGEFIPLFERNGFIVSLDFYILEEVCKYIREQRQYTDIEVYVNISGNTALSAEFVKRCIEIKEKYGIKDGVIVLEFSEKIASRKTQQLKEILLKIKKAGFSIAMDNFGSGVSSLETLRYFPVDYLKLDGSFAKSGMGDETDRVILASVISMAKVLHMVPISTIIEDEQQVAFLQKMGCDLVQGFVFGEAVSGDKLNLDKQYAIKLVPVDKESYMDRIDEYQNLNIPYVLDIYRETSMLVDNVVGGIVQHTMNQGGKILYANRGFYNLIGYTKAQFEAECNNQIVSILKEHTTFFLQAMEHETKLNNVFSCEFKIQCRDGSEKWVMDQMKYNNDGTIYAFFTDVTAKKRIERELIQERERYKSAIENSNDILYEYDFGNDTLKMYQNITEGGVQKQVVSEQIKKFRIRMEGGEYVHPSDVDKVLENFGGKKVSLFEIQLKDLVKKDGNYHWYLLQGAQVNGLEEAKRVVGTIRDIEHYKYIEKENARLHSQFALSIRNIYDAVYEFDREEETCYFLSIEEDGIQRRQEKVSLFLGENQSYLQYIHPEDRERYCKFIEETRKQEKEEYYIEVRKAYTDENYCWYSFLCRPSETNKNVSLMFLKNIDDAKHEEKTRQRQLEQALQMAENANSAKTDFLSRMSHDIRTPMNAISGMTEIAKRKIEDRNSVLDCLNKINNSSEYLQMLINDILDMSRIEKGKMVLQKKRFSLVSLVEKMKTLIEVQAIKKGISFDVCWKGSGSEYFVADELRINQIIMNLLSNALKFTPTGGTVTLTVEYVYEEDVYKMLHFSVQDTGIGMEKEFINKMYMPFEQENTNDARDHVGSGLGLSIVKNLVDLMQGRIEVSSETGMGSTFEVWLPLEQVKEQNTVSDIHSDKTKKKMKKLSKVQRVLLVEDNELNLEIAQQLLEMEGMQVDVARNGQEAVEKYKQSGQYYQVILMDIRMPVMDGIEATRTIRRLEESRNGHISIIAMSANAFTEDKEKAQAAGMDDYLVKPVNLTELLAILDTIE